MNRAKPSLKIRISALISTFVSIILISCFLAPPLRWALDSFGIFQGYDIHRILSRLIIFFLIVSLIIFRRSIFSTGKIFNILKPDTQSARLFFIAFVFGVTTLTLHVVLAILFGARDFYTTNFSWHKFIAKGTEAFFAASFIGVLEEFLFRGVLFGSLNKIMRLPLSFTLSSFIYSLAHFFKPKEITVNPDSIFAGFCALLQMAKPIMDTGFFAECAGLFLVGLCLCAGYYYMRSLYFAIGLHAGWVFVIKMDGMVAARTLQDKIFLWGSSNLVGGIFTWILLIIIYFMIIYVFAPKLKNKNPAVLPQ